MTQRRSEREENYHPHYIPTIAPAIAAALDSLRDQLAMCPLSAHARRMADILLEAGYEVAITGGALIDWVDGRPPKDYDLVTSAGDDEITQLLDSLGISYKKEGAGKRHSFTIDAPSDAKEGNLQSVDLTSVDPEGTFRKHTIFKVLLEMDSDRRNFTCSALYVDVRRPRDRREIEVHDFHDGLWAIHHRIITTINKSPAEYFCSTPVNMLRAIPLMLLKGYSFEEETLAAIQNFHKYFKPNPKKDIGRNAGWARYYKTLETQYEKLKSSYASLQDRPYGPDDLPTLQYLLAELYQWNPDLFNEAQPYPASWLPPADSPPEADHLALELETTVVKEQPPEQELKPETSALAAEPSTQPEPSKALRAAAKKQRKAEAAARKATEAAAGSANTTEKAVEPKPVPQAKPIATKQEKPKPAAQIETNKTPKAAAEKKEATPPTPKPVKVVKAKVELQAPATITPKAWKNLGAKKQEDLLALPHIHELLTRLQQNDLLTESLLQALATTEDLGNLLWFLSNHQNLMAGKPEDLQKRLDLSDLLKTLEKLEKKNVLFQSTLDYHLANPFAQNTPSLFDTIFNKLPNKHPRLTPYIEASKSNLVVLQSLLLLSQLNMLGHPELLPTLATLQEHPNSKTVLATAEKLAKKNLLLPSTLTYHLENPTAPESIAMFETIYNKLPKTHPGLIPYIEASKSNLPELQALWLLHQLNLLDYPELIPGIVEQDCFSCYLGDDLKEMILGWNQNTTYTPEDRQTLMQTLKEGIEERPAGYALKALLAFCYQLKHPNYFQEFYINVDAKQVPPQLQELQHLKEFVGLCAPYVEILVLQKNNPKLTQDLNFEKAALKTAIINYLAKLGEVERTGAPRPLLIKALSELLDILLVQEPVEIFPVFAKKSEAIADLFIANYNYLKARQQIQTLKLSREEQLILVTRIHQDDSANPLYTSITSELITILFTQGILTEKTLRVVINLTKPMVLSFALRLADDDLSEDDFIHLTQQTEKAAEQAEAARKKTIQLFRKLEPSTAQIASEDDPLRFDSSSSSDEAEEAGAEPPASEITNSSAFFQIPKGGESKPSFPQVTLS